MRMLPERDRDRVAIVAALVGPLLLCALLVPFRDSFANTDAALALVLVVVAIAANGHRLAGVLAAVSGALWFDFFLTAPYERFSITRRADIETTALLLVVGVGVSELAIWGRRQHALARQRGGDLAGIYEAAEVVASGGSSTELIERVSGELTRLLELRECQFQYGVAGRGGPPRLQHDGRFVLDGRVWDPERATVLPGEVELLVQSGGLLIGRFLLYPGFGWRPPLPQRLVAVALADQVGAALDPRSAPGRSAP